MKNLIKFNQYEEALYYIKEENPNQLIKSLDFELDYEELFQTLTNKGFFSDESILIINNIKSLNNNKHKNIGILSKALSSSNDTIYFTHDFKINTSSEILSNKEFNIIDLTNSESKLEIIYKYFKGTLDSKIINYTFKVLDGDFIFTINELERIQNLGEISLDLVKLNIHSPIEANVFILLEHILLKQNREAILLFDKLIANKMNHISILSIMETQIKFIMQIKILNNKYNAKDISTVLEVHEFRVKKNLPLVNKTNELILFNTYKKIALLDYQVKAGIIDAESILIKILST